MPELFVRPSSLGTTRNIIIRDWVLMTPEDIHYRRASGIIEDRQDTLLAAYDKHPERFKYRIPKPMVLPEAVWINKPLLKSDGAVH